VFLVLLSTLCWSAALLRAAPDDGNVRQLIAALADPDPREREKAEKGILALGMAARDAVVEATKSDDPELASRARGVLLQLPWSLPSDSPVAKQALARYGKSPTERTQIIQNLVGAHEVSVLLRLLEEEPETEMRWTITRHLSDRKTFPDLELDRRLKDISETSTNAPLVYLAAKRAEGPDRPRALKLYQRVIELESVVSAPAQREVFDAFDELIREAMRGADHTAATALLRDQALRMTGNDLGRIAATRLMAMHAYLGPLPGFARDVRALGQTTGPVTLAHRLASLYDRLGLAAPPFSVALGRTSASVPLETRYWAGLFLFQQRMLEAAELELNYIVAARPKPTPREELERGAPTFYDYDAIAAYAHGLLSRLVGERGDDLAAAEHLRLEAELRGETPDQVARARIRNNLPRNDNDFAEMHWRYLRAARTAGDHKKLREHLDVLKNLSPANTDIVIDVVPLLKEAGQPEAARAMFDKTYKQIRDIVDANPGEPEPMNNLAWLCSRSGERLPEALEMATKAITLDPDNAAYLDTAAEANFRVGNIDEAIRLETKGLEGRPNDKFMREQLERFKAAKK
jgi:tetratricopeptide (TPR) repeat protein